MMWFFYRMRERIDFSLSKPQAMICKNDFLPSSSCGFIDTNPGALKTRDPPIMNIYIRGVLVYTVIIVDAC